MLWVCPANAKIPDFIAQLFSDLDLSKRSKIPLADPLKGFRVYYAQRSVFLSQLFVRDARVEDNDDLLPILQRNYPKFLESQEEFFLADLVQNQGPDNK